MLAETEGYKANVSRDSSANVLMLIDWGILIWDQLTWSPQSQKFQL